MKIAVTFECQSCKKADATKKAVAKGAPPTEEWAWRICDNCAAEKAPDGTLGWVVIGELKPLIKDTNFS